MLTDIEDDELTDLNDVLLLLERVDLDNVEDVISICHRFYGCAIYDDATTLKWRNDMLRHLVLWVEENASVDVITSLYSCITRVSMEMFDGYVNEIGTYTPPSLRDTFVCNYTVSQLLTAITILDSEWNCMTYSPRIFLYLEQYDAQIGRFAFAMSDEEFDEQCDVEDYAGKRMLFIEHCSMIMSKLHRHFAIASSCLGSEYVSNGDICTQIENNLLGKCMHDQYAGYQVPFRNTYWAMAESPSDGTMVKMSIEMAKENKTAGPVRLGAIITSRKILKLRGKREFVAVKEAMFGKDSWILYRDMNAGEDPFDRGASGALLLYLCEYYLRMSLKTEDGDGAVLSLDINNWFSTYVDLYPTTSIWDKSRTTPVIVKLFSEYHVIYNGITHACGHASKAIEKWLRICLPASTLRQHFNLH